MGFSFLGKHKPLLAEMAEAGIDAYAVAESDKVKAFVVATFTLNERIWGCNHVCGGRQGRRDLLAPN